MALLSRLFPLASIYLIFVSSQKAMGLAATSTPRLDKLSLVTHAGAVISAGVEVMEDFESVGHGHGLLLIAGSKLCREMNVIREAVVEEGEDVERTMGQSPALKCILHPLLTVLGSSLICVFLAMAGLAAAVMEVMEDSRPGGHHGLIFLAGNELLEMLEQAKIARGKFLRAIENRILRLFLLLSATVFASIETIRSVETGLGAHHGVLMLGLSKTLRCVGLLRSTLKEEKEE